MALGATLSANAAENITPYTEGYCFKDNVSAYMNNYSSAYLEIMFLITQSNEEDAYDVRTPQYFSRANASDVMGSHGALTGYDIQSTSYSFYVDYAKVDNFTLKPGESHP